MHPKMSEISRKVTSAGVKSNFGGPAGGEALSRAEPPAGPPKSTKIAGESVFRKIRPFFGLMTVTLESVILREKNFPRPLAHRIGNYMHLSRF